MRKKICNRWKDNWKKKVIDINQDIELIISAFKTAYNIDLIQELDTLEFGTFITYLTNLPLDTRFMEIVKIRSMNPADIKDDKLRKLYNELSVESKESKEKKIQAEMSKWF